METAANQERSLMTNPIHFPPSRSADKDQLFQLGYEDLYDQEHLQQIYTINNGLAFIIILLFQMIRILWQSYLKHLNYLLQIFSISLHHVIH